MYPDARKQFKSPFRELNSPEHDRSFPAAAPWVKKIAVFRSAPVRPDDTFDLETVHFSARVFLGETRTQNPDKECLKITTKTIRAIPASIR